MTIARKAALALAALYAIASSAASADETIAYTYDARGRLVQVAHSGMVNAGVQTTYTLDAADNRTHQTTTGAPH
jgi:YD repeat-containing protein